MVIPRTPLVFLAIAVLSIGCASPPRQLMPTPLLYQGANSGTTPDAVVPHKVESRIQAGIQDPQDDATDVDLLYITDRGPETDPKTNPESDLPYGQARSRTIAFGSARVKIGDGLTWRELEQESRLAERTLPLELALGRVSEIGRFPQEPYAVQVRDRLIYRDPVELSQHQETKRQFRAELQRRLARSADGEVMLYVHGFNETFATSAFTAAELCHFLGREPVCAFFTWPASSTGNFLISYTNTTESARFAENHLRKVIRLIATTPGVKRIQLLAHSRGTSVLMSTVRSLMTEAVAAGKEPADVLKIDNIVLFSPDIDMDLAVQDITAGASDPDMFSVWPSGRLPRALNGRLTVYSSPSDRALKISRILFRSRERIGNLRAEDVPIAMQEYMAQFDKMDLIVYGGKRTDAFGHSYFTTNPRVSSDVIALLRFGKQLGEPGRELIRKGPIIWEFPNVQVAEGRSTPLYRAE